MAVWKFKPLAEDDTRENPIQSQFFTTDEVGSMANVLIREGIQNALDEQLDKTKPVEICITIAEGQNAISPADYNCYLDGLTEHLQSKESGLRELPDFANEKMDFLVFEDFNTNGLRGNPIESKDSEIENELAEHNFYFFWRNVGITGKAKDKLGRWGVGKTVFPASSRINTFWGYTIQSDTQNQLLLGQSILRKHNIESNPQDWGYKPYGYFGNYSNGSFFARPLEEQEALKKFKTLFRLKRKSESGLSLIIPFFKKEIEYTQLLTAITSQYFYPILNDKLQIEIVTTERSIKINKNTVDEIVDSIKISDQPNNDNILSLFNFTKWIINLGENEYIKLNAPSLRNQPSWSESLWSELNVDDIILQFELKRRIAFKVPVKYQNVEKDSESKICWFKVFLERNEKLERPEDHFIRENITIIDIKSLEGSKIRGIVIIDDKDLANLLGDSENPAHTQWQANSQNFANKYVHGDKCINFVVRSLQKIYMKLQKPADGLDKEILKDFFYIEEDTLDSLPILPDDDSIKDEITQKPKVDLPHSKKSSIKVRKIEDGITIYSDSLTDEMDPLNIKLKLAYMTTRGKPIEKYRSFDFELNKAPIQITPKNCKVITHYKNQMNFITKGTNFEMTLKGFDHKRDLFIKLDTELIEDDKEI